MGAHDAVFSSPTHHLNRPLKSPESRGLKLCPRRHESGGRATMLITHEQAALELCDGKTSMAYSGSPFIDVVRSVQDWARPDGASHRAQLRSRRLQSERSMRPVLVVGA